MNSTLAAIAARLGIEAPPGAEAVVVSDVEHDSRRVGPGMLFACIPGAGTDGHDHAPEAVAAGAVALLVERPLGLGVPELVVERVRSVLGPAAALVHGDPSRALQLVGVTGTNGKTTTVHLLADVVESLGAPARRIGTLTGARTTPEAPELQRMLAEARDASVAVVAMEVSSHALDLGRVGGCRFAVAAFTNLGIDHLDHHGTVEAYYQAKKRLFAPGLSATAVIDTRSAPGARLARECEIPVTEISEKTYAVVDAGATRSRFRWRDQLVQLPLGGAFNVANAVMAAEIALALGHAPGAVARALAGVTPVPGRFEAIDEGQPFAVIVDYAHTPDGLEALLAAAREVAKRSLVVVFGAGGDRDRSKRPRMGEVARRLADRVVVTSDNPRGEDPAAVIAGIVSGMDTAPDLVEPDRRLAIRHALAAAGDGDVVVLAGKGHETTQTVGDEVVPFDDRAVAREELRRLTGAAS